MKPDYLYFNNIGFLPTIYIGYNTAQHKHIVHKLIAKDSKLEWRKVDFTNPDELNEFLQWTMVCGKDSRVHGYDIE